MDDVDKGPRKRETCHAGRCTRQVSKTIHSRSGKVPSKDGDGGITTKRSEPFSLKKVNRVKKLRRRSLQGYRLVDMNILQDIISCLSCSECLETGTLYVHEDDERTKGLPC